MIEPIREQMGSEWFDRNQQSVTTVCLWTMALHTDLVWFSSGTRHLAEKQCLFLKAVAKVIVYPVFAIHELYESDSD